MALTDRYEVHGPMGEGGFAKVYRASERTGGRSVALKVLKRDFRGNDEVLERFQREVFAVASLSSPHIVSLYDFELSDEDVFIAMEYVAGPTLRERLHDPLTLAERYTIIEQIGEAIAVAHERNVVHRDLKPENVKLAERADGAIQVKVLDFGMAKLADLESKLELRPLTRRGICFGTPHYMAPEQIRGHLDGNSIDLYALTTIAFELLTGARPWDADDPYEVMRAVLRTPTPPIRALAGVAAKRGPQLEAVNEFFQRALSKQIEDRPRDARELVSELGQALFGPEGLPRRELAPLPVLRRTDDTAPLTALRSSAAIHVLPSRDMLQAAESVRALISEDLLRASGAVPALRTEETLNAPSAAATNTLSTIPRRSAPIDPDVQAEALAAAQALAATGRGLGGLWLPLLVIIALGSSVGYLLAGSASAQSSQLNRLVSGDK